MRLYLPLVFLLGSMPLLVGRGSASIVYNSEIKSRYFQALDNRSREGEITDSWRWWLQVHRAIRLNTQLAKKLALSPPDLREKMFESGQYKIRQLGLICSQVERQSVAVYTLQVGSFRNSTGVSNFLKRYWLSKNINHLKVYNYTPKQLTFFASAEETTKTDPLYLTPATLRGQKFVRLCYGVYENKADARADQQVIERHLALPIQITPEQLTPKLVYNVLFQPVEGKVLDGWEVEG